MQQDECIGPFKDYVTLFSWPFLPSLSPYITLHHHHRPLLFGKIKQNLRHSIRSILICCILTSVSFTCIQMVRMLWSADAIIGYYNSWFVVWPMKNSNVLFVTFQVLASTMNYCVQLQQLDSLSPMNCCGLWPQGSSYWNTLHSLCVTSLVLKEIFWLIFLVF